MLTNLGGGGEYQLLTSPWPGFRGQALNASGSSSGRPSAVSAAAPLVGAGVRPAGASAVAAPGRRPCFLGWQLLLPERPGAAVLDMDMFQGGWISGGEGVR